MENLSTIQQICIWALPILFAITLHEAAHGYVAHKLGDDTAYRLGRVTANPLKHIDPLGTIVIPLLLMLTTKFIFGWAKPVPVDPLRLRNPKRDVALVAIAGPIANLLMAIAWMALLKYSYGLLSSHPTNPVTISYFFYMAQAGVMINLVLMALNILPIPPLDGSRIVTSLLPAPWDKKFNQITPYGFLLVLLLAVSGLLAKVLVPMVIAANKLLFTLFNLH